MYMAEDVAVFVPIILPIILITKHYGAVPSRKKRFDLPIQFPSKLEKRNRVYSTEVCQVMKVNMVRQPLMKNFDRVTGLK